MSLKLKELIVQNLNTYKGTHSIKFSDYNGNLVHVKGVNAIDGSSNGTGKSTLINAIVLALFNKSLKKEINLDDLICDQVEGDPFWKIVLSFEDSKDGVVNKNYRIERTKRLGSSTKCDLYENDVCISKNLTTTETQNKIESIIGLDYQVFINNNVLNPELFKFVKANSTQKIEILEKVLNLHIVSKLFSSLSNAEKTETTTYSSISREFYAAQKALESLAAQNEELSSSVAKNVAVMESNIVDRTAKIDEKQKNVAELDDEIKSIESGPIKRAADELRSIEAKIAALKQKKTEHKNKIAFYDKNDICHTCKQTLPDKDAILEVETESLKEVEKKLTTAESSKKSIDISFKPNYDAKVAQRNSLRDEISNLKVMNESDAKAIQKFNRITEDVSKIDEARKDKEKLENENATAKKELDTTRFWRELIAPRSGTRAKIAGELLQILNKNISKYAKNFFIEDVHVSFSISDGDIVEVMKANGKTRKYDQFSSGERQKIDIIVVLSLLDIAMSHFKNNCIKFLLIDEALDHLDNVSGRYVMETIKDYAKSLNMLCLLISHHSIVEELDNLFDNVINVQKDSNSCSSIIASI